MSHHVSQSYAYNYYDFLTFQFRNYLLTSYKILHTRWRFSTLTCFPCESLFFHIFSLPPFLPTQLYQNFWLKKYSVCILLWLHKCYLCWYIWYPLITISFLDNCPPSYPAYKPWGVCLFNIYSGFFVFFVSITNSLSNSVIEWKFTLVSC